MPYEEKCVKENYIYRGKILNLKNDDVLLCNGELAKREIVEHNGGACVLYVENEEFLFVKQYRYAYQEEVLEIPAGKLEKGEDPYVAAARELEEETGINSENLQLIFTLYPSPGYTNEKIYIYLAKDGKRNPARLDEGEFLDVVWLKRAEVLDLLSQGKLHDSKTIVALQSYFLREKGEE